MEKKHKSNINEMVRTTDTDLWNDSCSVDELNKSINDGAVGATSNPTIVYNVLNQEMHLWKDRLFEIIVQNPNWTEVEVTWKIFEEIGVKGASILLPVFEKEGGKKGRLSIQTNPANYRNAEALVEQALHFHSLAPNMQVKIPATKAGISAIEESTYQGVNINATVCFTVPQSIAVAEAVERGLARRESEGKTSAEMTPVCTIMIGRLDDWLKVIADKKGILVDPAILNWAGIACIKKAYSIYQSRNYRTRLLAAAFRHHMHWSELIGGDLIQTITYQWQELFNKSHIEVKPRMNDPVSNDIIDDLYSYFDDFRKAYDEDGMNLSDFDSFGATVRTLRGFIASYHALQSLITDFMLPNPDVK